MEEKERRGCIVDRETDQAGVTPILECHEESNRWGMAENPPTGTEKMNYNIYGAKKERQN